MNRQSVLQASTTSAGLTALGNAERKEYRQPVPFYKVQDESTKTTRKPEDVKDNEWFEEYFKLELAIEEKND